ncbi:MAG: 6,7-dimethyl-8-ribityllumazine synthase [Corynebacterium sp.]|nr:6,7-dimethyl-8-ribityllumazine synthase [Corynebacterium sp.]
MPAEGLADITITPGSGAGLRIAVVSASWNPEITDRLHEHAVAALTEAGVHVCNAVTYGLPRVSLDSGKPVGNGVLTVENHQQAVDRSGAPGAVEDKGRDAANAALHTLLVLKDVRSRG